eukprot:SAG31_NODE_3326_length_4408_cov_3.213739_5_plen_179_part_01
MLYPVLSGPDLKSTIITLNDDLNTANISAATRMKLRDEIKAMEERQLQADKKAAAAKQAALIEEGCKLASDADSAGAAVLVLRFDAMGVDAKMATKVLKEEMQKTANKTAIACLSTDGKKVLCMVSVPKELSSKAKAGDVVKAVMPTLGGKGGGKPDFAQGQGTATEKIDQAIDQVADQ